MEIVITSDTGIHAAEIAASIVHKTPSEANLKPDDTYFFATLNDGTPIGVCRISYEAGVASLRGVEIQEAMRGQQIGARLIRDAVKASNKPLYCLCYDYLEPFYNGASFTNVDESTLPAVLQERLAGYRKRNPQHDFIAMVKR